MDNCPRDNKNNIMFGFLAVLVLLGIFESVEVSFLPIGHTHEDVDAMFSRFVFQVILEIFYSVDLQKGMLYNAGPPRLFASIISR